MDRARVNMFLTFTFVAILPTLMAHIVDLDEVWQKRAEEAWNNSLAAYKPNPEAIVNAFNEHGHTANINSTRRHLRKKYRGPCMAYNPIDRCWRCRKNWAKNRKRLANCVQGFGHRAIGGKKGPIYVVTDPSDNDVVNPRPGTLRHAVIQKGPLWIIFARSMTIRLSQELIMQGDKTIDARGANVNIARGAGITIQFVRNIIIHNLHFNDIVSKNGGMIRDSVDHVGIRQKSDGDSISIFQSSDIWIDHISMSRSADGLIDIVEGSTGITISNCHFAEHDKVLLFGADDKNPKDRIMQVTVAYNHFGKKLVQRMPRCRWGFFHLVNNDYTHWLMYAIGGSNGATIISQGNRFIAPPDPKAKETLTAALIMGWYVQQVTHRNNAVESEWKSWIWRSEGDVMMNGAFFVQSGNPNGARAFPNLKLIRPQPGTEVTRLTKFTGSLGCRVRKAC
ncbi:hypothetical protein RJ640_002118 [Escallonia rubra]|uniref:Pectate lyase n=1 Tax=Escallonia rubra TaxID=112253 RepID=A0AA88QCN4_9ASTE|nr:hypothetical protein RJ640_002118 [Escallonia rubra]